MQILLLVHRSPFYWDLNNNTEFGLMYCFHKLQNCQKWKKLRTSLKMGCPSNIPDVDASEGWPVGNKKAKAAIAVVANSEWMNASIDKPNTKVSKNSTERRVINDARWATLMEKTDKKLELEESKVAVNKRT